MTRDVGFFRTVFETAAHATPGARGLIVELLDGCNIECPTCIAGSGVLAGNIRPFETLRRQISTAIGEESLRAILLSGGEPTIHPDILSLTSYVAGLDVPSRVIITNGLRFSREPRFVQDFVAAGGLEVEVFLQFDSLNPTALLDIRGADYSAERIGALNALAEGGVSVTLVNVVKRGVTLDSIEDVLTVARAMPNVVGVQFQPIRDAGRVLAFDRVANFADVADVFDRLPGHVRLSPCKHSPWSTFIGRMDRGSGLVYVDGSTNDFFIGPTNAFGDEIRVAVLDYSDRYNWTSERSRLSALGILTASGGTPSVDDYFLGLEQTIRSSTR